MLGSLSTDYASCAFSLAGFVTQPWRIYLTEREHNYRTAMPFISGKLNRKFELLRPSLTAIAVLSLSVPFMAQAGALSSTDEICIPKGTYPMNGGGTTVFSQDRTCFSRPAIRPYPWEKKIARAKLGPPDPFNGARMVTYDYPDALYQCTKRHMRLPSVEELKALFVYANAGNGAEMAGKYAIVAPKDESRYPGGLYGWGGGSPYLSHTFAGKGFHKLVNLANGRVSIDHDSRRSYVSCVR